MFKCEIDFNSLFILNLILFNFILGFIFPKNFEINFKSQDSHHFFEAIDSVLAINGFF